MSRDLRCLCLLGIVMLSGVTEARAYTDPGSGALLWQVLVGGLTGSLFYIRHFREWLSRRQSSKMPVQSESSTSGRPFSESGNPAR
jgi:hypothetical protein